MDQTCTPLMPGLWPPREPRHQPPRSEARVYAALKEGLPRGWYAWHSLRLRTPSGEFGEADFVLADPGLPGILVLEVKGGLIELVAGAWYQNDRPLNPPPLDQALGFRHKLLDCLYRRTRQVPKVGVAAVFPDCVFGSQPSISDAHDLLLGKQDLPRLAEALPGLMARAVGQAHAAGGDWPRHIHELWGDCWTPTLTLGQRAGLDRERLLRLDERQMMVLDLMADNDRVLVSGAAGSGKTLLAMRAARRMAADGRRVLLACYTDALARELERELRDPGIRVAAVKRLAAEILDRAGHPAPERDTPAFWAEVSLKAALEAGPEDLGGWDAVIVDEGQDLDESDWLLVEELAGRGKALWVFADQGQAFWPGRGVPEGLKASMFKVRLPGSYRSPEPIQHLVECYAGQCRPDNGLLRRAAQERVISVTPTTPEDLVRSVGREVNRLVSDGLPPREIAVLSLRGAEAQETIVGQPMLGTHPVARATDDDLDRKVVCDTFLRFKGLERSAVIITDLRLVSDNYDKRMHIAASRALSLLRVVGCEEEVRRDSNLKPCLI